jgi:hypothetical protein
VAEAPPAATARVGAAADTAAAQQAIPAIARTLRMQDRIFGARQP